jgi:RHS repeat-associated protein
MVRASKSLAATDITYDVHGNLTKMGNQTFGYDSSDRHVKTTVVDSGQTTTVDYKRGVSGEITERKETLPDGTTQYFRYAGSFVLTSANGTTFVPTQRTLVLIGDVSVSIPIVSGSPSMSTATWSYPNLHGDNTWTANAAGSRTGFYLYDPFGQPIDVATKVIGSSTADEAVPDSMPGSYDAGWVGSKGKGYEHAGSISIIEMGVRMYSAMLGRFLSPDPVLGGNTSWFNYPNDPINQFDLTGMCTPAQADHGGCGQRRKGSAKPKSPGSVDNRDNPVVDRWTAQGIDVVMRQQTLTLKLPNHNLSPQVVRWVTENSRAEMENGNPNTWIWETEVLKAAVGGVPSRTTVIRVVVATQLAPDGAPRGILTAYCKPESYCEDWVNTTIRREGY